MIEQLGVSTPEALEPATLLYNQLERYLAVHGIPVIREDLSPYPEGYSASHQLIALDSSLADEEATRALCRETTAFAVDLLLPNLSMPEAEIAAAGAAQMILRHHGVIGEPEYRQWAHNAVDEVAPHLGHVVRMAQRILTDLEQLREEWP